MSTPGHRLPSIVVLTVVRGPSIPLRTIVSGMNGATSAAARIQRFLEREPVVWLSTVRPDGSPHLVPIWFWWDGQALLVYSKPNAQKVRNLRERPSVMLALGDAEDDFDVGMVEGHAELLETSARDLGMAGHLAKYRDRMAAIGLTPDEFLATYSQAIRIRPVRFLAWHGRTIPASESLPVDPLNARMRAAIRRVALGQDQLALMAAR
jgi:PPOX class probable F420-dependent enzyme